MIHSIKIEQWCGNMYLGHLKMCVRSKTWSQEPKYISKYDIPEVGFLQNIVITPNDDNVLSYILYVWVALD